MNHVTRYHVTDTNILHTVLLSVLWFVWFGFCFFAFLFCFQRGIKMFSWKKFCICSREMGQKWLLKNFRVLWERNYFTRLWHWNFSIMSTSPLPHILSVVAPLSPILSKKTSSLNWSSLNTYSWTSSSALQKICCFVLGLFQRPLVGKFNYSGDFWSTVTDITGNGLQNVTSKLSVPSAYA